MTVMKFEPTQSVSKHINELGYIFRLKFIIILSNYQICKFI